MDGLVIGVVFVIALLSAVESLFSLMTEIIKFVWRHKVVIFVLVCVLVFVKYVKDGNNPMMLLEQLKAFVGTYI